MKIKNWKIYLKFNKYYLLRLLKIVGILNKFNFVLTRNIHGKSIKVPILGQTGLSNLVDVEEWLYKLYKKLDLIKKGSFIDVGINIGQTLIKIKSINPETVYYGFEPNPTCIYYAHQITKINKFQNVTIFPLGLADSKNLLTLYADNEIATGASILENFRENFKVNFKYSIPVWDFDDIKINLKEVAVVKIDVEGYELEVFKGMLNLLNEGRAFFICEILPVYSLDKQNGRYRYERQKELIMILKSANYKMFLIDEINFKLVSMSDIVVHGDMNRTNYMFCHESDSHILENLNFNVN